MRKIEMCTEAREEPGIGLGKRMKAEAKRKKKPNHWALRLDASTEGMTENSRILVLYRNAAFFLYSLVFICLCIIIH